MFSDFVGDFVCIINKSQLDMFMRCLLLPINSVQTVERMSSVDYWPSLIDQGTFQNDQQIKQVAQYKKENTI